MEYSRRVIELLGLSLKHTNLGPFKKSANIYRRGSSIHGDRFSKQVPKVKATRGVRYMLPR